MEKKEEEKLLARLRERIQDLDEAMEDAQVEERPEEEIKALWEEIKQAQSELEETEWWKEWKASKPAISMGFYD